MADQIAAPWAEDAGEPSAADGDARDSRQPLFSVEQVGQTLVIKPTIRGGKFRYTQLRTEANALRRKLGQRTIGGLILDLHELDYSGAEAIGAVVALARKVEDGGGRAVICRAAPHLTEALTKMGLHRLWAIFATREEAFAALESRA
jgi:anti-anti-sigma factor